MTGCKNISACCGSKPGGWCLCAFIVSSSLIVLNLWVVREFRSAATSLRTGGLASEAELDIVNKTQRFQVNKVPKTDIDIHMVAVADKSFQARYAVIFDSMSKYASKHGYHWHVIGDSGTEPLCEQKYQVFFFRKHCIIASWMDRETNVGDKVFVFDSDVVPYRTNIPLYHWTYLIEDIILYERTWNNEVAAGNYLVSNSEAAKGFLMRWAQYEKEIPPGFSSADNGAIHLHLIRSAGLEPERDGTCGQKYYSLTAPVTNLDPYFDFVDCTRKLAKPGVYTNDESHFSFRILKKDTAWVMDGVYDLYGKDGSGPGGFGPVFHHGVKLTGKDDEDLDSILKYGLQLNLPESNTKVSSKSCEPVFKSAECGKEARGFGHMSTPGECAENIYKLRKFCSESFMFSEPYPEWGCRCCVEGDTPKKGGELWSLYSVSDCIDNA